MNVSAPTIFEKWEEWQNKLFSFTYCVTLLSFHSYAWAAVITHEHGYL